LALTTIRRDRVQLLVWKKNARRTSLRIFSASFRQDLTLSIMCRERAAAPDNVEGVICDGHT
jgi:hypothetical protein